MFHSFPPRSRFASATASLPQWFLDQVKTYTPESQGHYIAQLLWRRGIQTPEILQGFLDANAYQPTSPLAFGQEMKWAIQRLKNAFENQEKVSIWGDFDADGITATSVLWEGLGQFFTPYLQLDYYIPNRATESHGLNTSGIKQLATGGTQLIITCDTGSTNITEIDYAQQLGIDVIITDHHTLPDERPPVVSIINPRYFSEDHSLFCLSGVAVAYKLIEALYQTLPDIPQSPLENLLDLVAIGLIADLVELRGDCRYLAQKGIQQLQKQQQNPTRPGVAELLQLCKRNGDRPTDISFGIGPRINAISRIYGDARFGVELLTNRDPKRCKELAFDTELANTRRKELQKIVTENVKKKLRAIDLSTTQVIVLEDPQWQSGVLGLVAGQIAQEYGRPTILLTTDEGENISSDQVKLARGSARSVNRIDLYQLVASQKYLLHRFGGHPYAAGLSLPIENIPLFREGINQQLRQEIVDVNLLRMTLEADLVVTVSELGQSLFRELKLLEPCGMGNPVPKLLIQNCWFKETRNYNQKDARGQEVKYIKTTFELWDDSVEQGFPGIWWGHYQEELPKDYSCDAMVELDFNPYHPRYEVRLVDVKKSLAFSTSNHIKSGENLLIDWRNQKELIDHNISYQILDNCPTNWDELQKIYRTTVKQSEKLALAYAATKNLEPKEILQQLVGIAKYLSRTQKVVTKKQLKEQLELSDRTLDLALDFLEKIGFSSQQSHHQLQFEKPYPKGLNYIEISQKFINTLKEEQFQRQYFSQVPLTTLQEVLA